MGVVLMSSLMVLTFVLYSLFAHLSLFFFQLFTFTFHTRIWGVGVVTMSNNAMPWSPSLTLSGWSCSSEQLASISLGGSSENIAEESQLFGHLQ